MLCTTHSPFSSSNDIRVVYSFLYKDCGSVHIGESGRSLNIRVWKHKRAFKFGDLYSNLINSEIGTGEIHYFENIALIKSNCNNYKSRILKEWFTSVQRSTLNEACANPAGYAVL